MFEIRNDFANDHRYTRLSLSKGDGLEWMAGTLAKASEFTFATSKPIGPAWSSLRIIPGGVYLLELAEASGRGGEPGGPKSRLDILSDVAVVLFMIPLVGSMQ